jgi:hypothetical protein
MIAFASSRVAAPRVVEWLAVPVTLIVANLGEYWGHRGPMHRPRRGFGLVFQRHTRQHHRFFVHVAMAYDSARDFKMVLFPPVLLVFFFGGIALPIGLVLFLVASSNIAWLYVASVMAYYLTYEWLHFAHHLPATSPIARLPWMAALRRHHTLHHDPKQMGTCNFNITFPLCDWVFGTLRR